ncbi:MAG: tetratricopeptide repeat-containing sensor histidine kinase [Cyclobacteriaceae bacterium]
MWRRIAVLLILLLTAFFSIAQNQNKADSLKQILSGLENDSSKLEILRLIMVYESNPTQSLHYSDELLDLAESNNNNEYKYHAYLFKGINNRFLGNIQLAVQLLFQSAEIADLMNNNHLVAQSYGELSNLYRAIDDSDRAISFEKRAINLLEKTERFQELALTQLNHGYSYYVQEEYDSAMLYTLKAKHYFDSTQSPLIAVAYSEGNLALIKARQGLLDIAEKEIISSIEKLESIGDSYGISDYLNQLATIYKESALPKKSIDYSNRSLLLSESNQFMEQTRDAYYNLYEVYQQLNQTQLALTYYVKYIQERDEINDIDEVQEIANIRTEYEVGLKQVEVDLLTQERRTQRILTYALGAVIFLITMIALIVYRNFREKNKVNIQLAELNSTKDKFFSIISHDLRGPVSAFHGVPRMIKMAVKMNQTEMLTEIADEVDKSTSNLSDLLDGLLNWAMQQQGRISYQPETLRISAIIDDLYSTLGNMAKSKQIELNHNIDESIVITVDKNTITTVFRNLINNALKFTPEGGRITVTAASNEQIVKVEVRDTGVGIPNAKLKTLFDLKAKNNTYGTAGEKGLGLGLQMVKDFVEMNRGTIGIQSQEGTGTTFTIGVPKG